MFSFGTWGGGGGGIDELRARREATACGNIIKKEYFAVSRSPGIHDRRLGLFILDASGYCLNVCRYG